MDNTPMDSEPFDRPPEPEAKPMSIEDAYYHLYQVEQYDWEDDAMFASRKVAREDFNRQLTEAGLTIQDLMNKGVIKRRPVNDSGLIIAPAIRKKLNGS